jgi:AP-1-like factor
VIFSLQHSLLKAAVEMGSTGTGGSLPPNFLLTPQQQSLLFAALNSNRGTQNSAASAKNSLSLETETDTSPTRDMDTTSFNESPYLDNYDYEFGDSSFDFSFANGEQVGSAKMIDDMPESAGSDSTDNDVNEKRGHPDDDDEEDSPEKDAKRHEGSEKGPKKPGRKPLTSEPSSVCPQSQRFSTPQG